MHLKIGSRGSPLALVQTNIFINALKKFHDFTYEIIKVKTTGDLILDKPLYDIGGKALFLKELEEALLDKKIDLAVHSLKDVPGIIDDRFMLGCFLEREYPQDCLISKKYKNIKELKSDSVIGTSSPRRAAFIKQIRPDLNILHIRGNINSRLERLVKGEFDAIILAEIGLRRLNLYDPTFCNPIPVDDMIPAVGQGVITCEILKENNMLKEILNKINDKASEFSVSIEREFLETLQADCKTPVAGYVRMVNGLHKGVFMIGSDDSTIIKTCDIEIDISLPKIGKKIANQILKEFNSLT